MNDDCFQCKLILLSSHAVLTVKLSFTEMNRNPKQRENPFKVIGLSSKWSLPNLKKS